MVNVFLVSCNGLCRSNIDSQPASPAHAHISLYIRRHLMENVWIVFRLIEPADFRIIKMLRRGIHNVSLIVVLCIECCDYEI